MTDDRSQLIIPPKEVLKTQFKQQILPAFTPQITMRSSIPLFFICGIIFLAIGITLLQYSDQVVMVSQNYSDQCAGKDLCTIKVSIPNKIKAPVFFYIELTNYYQNHRLYLNSKSVDQLAENSPTQKDLEQNCDGALTNKQMGVTVAADGVTALKDSDIANPCGFIAKSFFNDQFTPVSYNGNIFTILQKNILVRTNNIAWPKDKEKLYKNTDNWKQVQWIDKTNEQFMNWMRISSDQNFKKLWGRIESDMQGTYQIQIENNFDVSLFGGKKGIVFSSANIYGGKNYTLSYLYIAFGSLSIFISILFMIKVVFYPKEQLTVNDFKID